MQSYRGWGRGGLLVSSLPGPGLPLTAQFRDGQKPLLLLRRLGRGRGHHRAPTGSAPQSPSVAPRGLVWKDRKAAGAA